MNHCAVQDLLKKEQSQIMFTDKHEIIWMYFCCCMKCIQIFRVRCQNYCIANLSCAFLLSWCSLCEEIYWESEVKRCFTEWRGNQWKTRFPKIGKTTLLRFTPFMFSWRWFVVQLKCSVCCNVRWTVFSAVVSGPKILTRLA